MTSETAKLPGSCLCGAVSFVAVTGKDDMGACHCSMCRKWSGGVFFAVECDAVEIAEGSPLGVYRSSGWGERCFCQNCGSSLMWRSIAGDHMAVAVQAFEAPEKFRFASQIFIDEKPANYSFTEATHNMTGPEFIAMVTGGAAQ